MFDILDLDFDAYALSVDDNFLTVVVFSNNLGAVRIKLPLENLADYFGAIGNALKQIQDEDQ